MDYFAYTDFEGRSATCGLTLVPFLDKKTVWVICTALPENPGPLLADSLSPALRAIVQERLAEKYPDFSLRVFVHHPPGKVAQGTAAGDRIDSLAIPVELIQGISNHAEWAPARAAELKRLLPWLSPPWKIRLDPAHHPNLPSGLR